MANALNKVNSGGIEDGSIVNADIKSDAAIAGSKLADDSITEVKLDVHNAPSGTDKFLAYTSNGMEWAVPSQLSFANDANNRVVTGTGSGLNGEANLTFDGSKLVIPTTGSNDANSNSDGAGFSSGSLHLRTRGATAGIAGTDYSNQIISNNGSNVALEIFTTGSNTGTPVVFGTNGTQRARVETNGNFTISDGDLVIGTAGHGIDFSATSGTGTSELLDDYEEGTFTPLNVSMSAVSDAYTGRYTKIGNQVFISVSQTAGTVSFSAGNAIKGLPFTVSGSTVVSITNRQGNINGNGYTYQDGSDGKIYVSFAASSQTALEYSCQYVTT